MRKVSLILTLLCFSVACSPRDFLTRRLASALIAGSEVFTAPQQFWLRIGPVSSKDYSSPQYLVLQHRGWIVGSATPCPPEVTPPPCYEVELSPAGVDAFHDLIRGTETGKEYFSIPTARRELVTVTGISRNANLADVEFTWKWIPLNEVGSALNVGGLQYKSTVSMKHYDDGWRLIESGAARSGQPLEDALKNADPVP
ncbi:MAG TPA: hypothetical protein VK466_11470 [Terriglobales bacterium]|nr:hypothetical protein [Terriglobales bacterium]